MERSAAPVVFLGLVALALIAVSAKPKASPPPSDIPPDKPNPTNDKSGFLGMNWRKKKKLLKKNDGQTGREKALGSTTIAASRCMERCCKKYTQQGLQCDTQACQEECSGSSIHVVNPFNAKVFGR